MSFLGDLQDGVMAEDYVISLLRRAGFSVRRPPGGKDECLDLLINMGDLAASVEVKFDKMEASSGNIAIEYEKPRLKKPSGIAVTTAEFWVYVVKSPLAAYIVPVQKLRQFMQTNRPKKTVKWAGDGNASIVLYGSHDILPIFYGLSETAADEIPLLIRGMLCK